MKLQRNSRDREEKMKTVKTSKTFENTGLSAYIPGAGASVRCQRRTINVLPEPGPLPDG